MKTKSEAKRTPFLTTRVVLLRLIRVAAGPIIGRKVEIRKRTDSTCSATRRHFVGLLLLLLLLVVGTAPCTKLVGGARRSGRRRAGARRRARRSIVRRLRRRAGVGKDRAGDGAGDGGGVAVVDVDVDVVVVVVVVAVKEGGNGGVEVPIVGLQEEIGFFSGGGGDLAEGTD